MHVQHDDTPHDQTDRRTLLKRAAALGLAIPVGGFFTVEGPAVAGQRMTEQAMQQPTPPGAGIGSGGKQPGTGSGTPVAKAPTPFVPMDPRLPAVQPGPKHLTVIAEDATVYIAQDVVYAGWSLGGTIPGRALRVVEGDTVTVTVRNEAPMAHSLDTHAAQTPPNKNY